MSSLFHLTRPQVLAYQADEYTAPKSTRVYDPIRNNILDPNPTRPLLHCYPISDLDNTLCANNSITSKAWLIHPPRVLVPTELQ